MSKCKHIRTELILRSRRYETIQEIPVDVWHDFIVGVKCLDCNDTMPTPEIMITRYPYGNKLHYQVKNSEEEPVKSNSIPEFNC